MCVLYQGQAFDHIKMQIYQTQLYRCRLSHLRVTDSLLCVSKRTYISFNFNEKSGQVALLGRLIVTFMTFLMSRNVVPCVVWHQTISYTRRLSHLDGCTRHPICYHAFVFLHSIGKNRPITADNVSGPSVYETRPRTYNYHDTQRGWTISVDGNNLSQFFYSLLCFQFIMVSNPT